MHLDDDDDVARFDASQREALDVGPSGRQIVVAGPGSGKTEVVSELIARLSDQGVDAVDEILVISFSNAAVRAVDSRLRSRGLPPAAVQTLDSLAAEIVHDLTDDAVERMGFDQRIQSADRALRTNSWERLENIQHLIVDEVQDLVGTRADLALQVIRRMRPDAGFTLLGDLAQGIYDFQIRPDRTGREPLSSTPSQALLHVASQLGTVKTVYLTGQYRATSEASRAAIALRQWALSESGGEVLAQFVENLPRFDSLTEALTVIESWQGTTALLTANNGQALLTADSIRDTGAAIELRRSANQRFLAAWIATLLADSPRKSVDRERFDELVGNRTPDLDSDELWRSLRSLADGRVPEIDVDALSKNLQRRRPIPPDLLVQNSARIVVSTVHRAKGLEFDNVVLVEFPDKPWFDDPSDTADAARTQFVALTRAKAELMRVAGPNDRQLSRLTESGPEPNRWIRRGYKKRSTLGIEVRAGDLESSRPGGTDEAGVQRALLGAEAGSECVLALNHDLSTAELPVYDVLLDQLVVGSTSRTFGESLARRRFKFPGQPPLPWPRLTGARLDGVSTIVGSPQQGEVGRRGMWLGAEVTGMLRIDWRGL